MIRPTEEEPTILDLALARAGEHADDDVAREYEELSELEGLETLAAPTGGEGALLETADELALARDELEELAALAAPADFASTHLAERETTEDRVARGLEGMDLDDLDALARWDEEAGARASPDDTIEREAEAMGG